LLELSEDSDRLEELLNRMLRLARVEQWAEDGIRRDLELTDLASTCEMAIARISGLASARNVRVTFSSEGTPQMRADAADLELVWINLLENAVQHSFPDSVVQISLRAEDGVANVCVQDTGTGVAEADLPHIFERFRRGDPSRSRATGGFGLGLAIAKSIVEAYGGKITAKSKLGEGTQISVILPVEKSSISPVAPPPSVPQITT
jgi:signal transduction histidine kinase